MKVAFLMAGTVAVVFAGAAFAQENMPQQTPQQQPAGVSAPNGADSHGMMKTAPAVVHHHWRRHHYWHHRWHHHYWHHRYWHHHVAANASMHARMNGSSNTMNNATTNSGATQDRSPQGPNTSTGSNMPANPQDGSNATPK